MVFSLHPVPSHQHQEDGQWWNGPEQERDAPSQSTAMSVTTETGEGIDKDIDQIGNGDHHQRDQSVRGAQGLEFQRQHLGNDCLHQDVTEVSP